MAARIDTVLIVGNYTLCTWFSCSAGGFVVTLDGVLVTGVAGLEVGPGGRLRAEEIGMDVTFDKIAMDFKNLGFMMSVFQVRSEEESLQRRGAVEDGTRGRTCPRLAVYWRPGERLQPRG